MIENLTAFKAIGGIFVLIGAICNHGGLGCLGLTMMLNELIV